MSNDKPPWETSRNMPPKGGSINLFEAATRLWSLEQAWLKVRANRGCAGSDGVTVEAFERRAAQRLLGLSHKLRDGRYRPKPLRLFEIPKRDGRIRRLAVPTILDRVAQTAVATALMPVIDPELEDASFAYRPGRSVKAAVDAIRRHRDDGFVWVVEGDIETFFDSVPHALLLDKLEALLTPFVASEPLLDLVAVWLEAAGLDLDARHCGIPQGSPLSPLLSNLYLDAVDEAFVEHKRHVRLVRYADDFVILCKREETASRALEGMADLLATHGLRLHPEKTRIVPFDHGFRFLGHLFIRSMVLVSKEDDTDDETDELMRHIARRDRDEAAADAEGDRQKRAGLDPALRILYLHEPGRVLATRNAAFTVLERGIDSERELLVVPVKGIDRIEVGPEAAVDEDAVRLALLSDVPIHHVNGRGHTVGMTITPQSDHAALHLAQARIALDDGLRLDLARRLVDGRLRNQRAILTRLNRGRRLAEVLDATKTVGRILRKLPVAVDPPELLGHEGNAGAVYWPALAALVQPKWATAKGRFKRQRHPAPDPFNLVLNYLASLLMRDVEVLLARHGLHPGFGVLHSSRNGHDAAVYDLIESYRAPLAEGLAVYLFNNRMLDENHFKPAETGGVRLTRDGHRPIVSGYQDRLTDSLKSPRSQRRITWRRLIEEDIVAYARHCRDQGIDDAAFQPYRVDY